MHAAVHHLVEAQRKRVVPGRGDIRARHHSDALVGHVVVERVTATRGPDQPHLDLGVHQRRANGKGVYLGNRTKHGDVCLVAHAMVGGKARRQRTRHELGLVHAPVVGAHAAVRQITGAVEETHLRVGDGRFGRTRHERGRAGKDHAHALRNGRVHYGREVVWGGAAVVGNGLHRAVEALLDLKASGVVGTRPTRGCQGPLVEKRQAKRIGWRVGRVVREPRENADVGGWLCLRLAYQHHILARTRQRKLGPQAPQPLDHNGGWRVQKALVREVAQVREKRVAAGSVQVRAARALVERAEVLVGGGELAHGFVGPGGAKAAAEKRGQPPVGALARELDVIGWRCSPELEELAVESALRGVPLLGEQSRDLGFDGICAQIAHHGGAFVALLDVEAVHILVDLDGVAEALCGLDGVEV